MKETNITSFFVMNGLDYTSRSLLMPDRFHYQFHIDKEEYVMNKSKISTAMIAKLAMMTALSIVLLMIVRIPFPPAPFLVFDPADVPIYITAFAYGPAAGLIVTLIVCLIQAFMLGGDGLYGFLMHFVATGVVALFIGYVYGRSRTRKTAMIALAVAVVIATVVMCIMNIIVTPAYMGAPRSAVIAMIPTVIIPFNLLKAGINALLTCVLYKRVSGFLHKDRAVTVSSDTE
jgi:riboflavin transporter FmnP